MREGRVIALAGVFQACALVRDLATQGRADAATVAEAMQFLQHTRQELAQQPVEADQDMLPAGMNEDGVIEDMQAYDAWLEGEQIQRDMQRREEVNINHSRSEQDDIEIGGNF